MSLIRRYSVPELNVSYAGIYFILYSFSSYSKRKEKERERLTLLLIYAGKGKASQDAKDWNRLNVIGSPFITIHNTVRLRLAYLRNYDSKRRNAIKIVG